MPKKTEVEPKARVISLASAFRQLLQFGCEIPAGSGGFFI
jgi:hypothetical protein